MSNQAVGTVYQTIIDEVINTSRVDFEESGVEESVLEELRQGWQQKLSQLDVARFPWDPKPEPPPPAPTASAQTHAAAQSTTQAQFSPNLSLPAGAPGSTGHNGAKPEQDFVKHENEIKHEPGTQAPLPALPSYNGADKNSLAASRAAQRLADQYGSLAAGSISAIQAGHKQQPQTQNPQAQNPQAQNPQAQNLQAQNLQAQNLQAQNLQTQNSHPPQAQVPAGASSISNGQTDGPGDAEEEVEEEDYEGILMRRNAEGTLHELGRVDIDRMLHGQVAAKAKAMEGGGLMLPLKKAASQGGRISTRAKGKGIAAYDGGDDYDDIDDEDAINSDLDDPEDDHDDDEVDDEGLGHIMLCMYDKVQRVKNKWKCTLKDGVLTVNGKEYVFHKATGEYEW